jgi:hypothetical protein
MNPTTPNELATLIRDTQRLFSDQPKQAALLLATWIASAFMMDNNEIKLHMERLDELLGVAVKSDQGRVLWTIRRVAPSAFWKEIDQRIDAHSNQRPAQPG